MVTHRWYLSDAVFLVSLTGDANLIKRLSDAVDRPVYSPVLGRRSCIPTGRLNLGVHLEDPRTLIAEYPWQAGRTALVVSTSTPVLDACIDDPRGDDMTADVPAGFAPLQRNFGQRRVAHFTVQPPHPCPPQKQSPADDPDHDALTLLEM